MGRSTTIVLMNRFAYILTLSFLIGCSSNSSTLIPMETGENYFWMFYPRSEVKLSLGNNISNLERYKIYEQNVNIILQSAPNTSSCRVVEGSINFGEPGSGGTAKVKCLNTIPLEKSGLFNRDGSASYKYSIKRVNST